MKNLRSKLTSYFGAAVMVVGLLSEPDVLALFPPKVAHIVMVVGGILALLGRSLLASGNVPPAEDATPKA